MKSDDFPKTPADFFSFAKKQQAEMVDLKFVDLLGSWQHCSFPIDHLDTGTFEEGLGFDGSSIRGWMGIHESDMMAVPDADDDAARSVSFESRRSASSPTSSIPLLGRDFTRDPRHVARKAEAYLKESGIADTCYIGPEPEFFIFDEVRYEQNQHRGYYEIDSVEGAWNTARIEEPNLGYKPSFKGGYFPVSPTDTFHDLRGEMVYEMRKIGIIVEAHHHEVATAGQSEIDMRFLPLLKMADQFMWYKYICKNVAKRHGKTVTFMPKPIFEDNGSGMHTHTSLWKGGKPLFAGDGYAGLSPAGSLCGRRTAQARPCDSCVRSADHQLVPPAGARLRGTGQPRALGAQPIGRHPHSDVLEEPEGQAPRVPMPGSELQRVPGLVGDADGDDRRHPEQDRSRQAARSRHLRDDARRNEARWGSGRRLARWRRRSSALEQDHEFLPRGDVFTEDLIETWVEWKRSKELDPDPAPPASARVLAVLRQLGRSG